MRHKQPLLRVWGLVKQFGTLQAINGLSLTVNQSEVLGIAGQSGSGKTLLMTILAGLVTPDAGQLEYNGNLLAWPFRAHKLGIGVIHQKPQIIDTLDITSNVFVGQEIFWPQFRGWRLVGAQEQMDAIVRDRLAELGIYPPSMRQKAGTLSREDHQMLAIARTLLFPVRLLIIDNPMATLNYRNQQRLLEVIREWKQNGTAVIFSSDNLDDLFAVADRIVTLRRGRIVGDNVVANVEQGDIVSQMVGVVKNQELTPIIWALERYQKVRRQTEELMQDRIALQRDLVARDALNQQLIEQLNHQMKTLDATNIALQAAHRRLLLEREHERKHLARELHDQTIQDLLGLNYQLEEIGDHTILNDELRMEMRALHQHVAGLIDDLRRICSDLRPPTLDSLGLASALKSLAYEWSNRSDIPIDMNIDYSLGHLPESIELNIFRIVQEALNNVQKHARASKVHIHLILTRDQGLRLSIADDGQGIHPGFDLSRFSANGHYGLVGISERVALLGGQLKLDNQPGSGLTILVNLPVVFTR